MKRRLHTSEKGTYHWQRQAQNHQIGNDVRDHKTLGQLQRLDTVLDEILRRAEQSPEPVSALEDQSQGEADGPQQDDDDHDLGGHVERSPGEAAEDAPVEEDDAELHQAEAWHR